jgi:hypothetical protein
MSLQVWLPLNGSLKNIGCQQIAKSSGSDTYTSLGKIGNRSLNLSAAITFSGLQKTKTFSVAFWVRVDACTTDWTRILQINTVTSSDGSAANFRFEAANLSGSVPRCCSWHNNLPYSISNGSRILITAAQKTQWHHCCVTYNGNNVYSYTDGILIGTDTGLGGYFLNSFIIGSSTAITGYMNDLRIYDHCLSVKEVKMLARGLILHYTLSRPGDNLYLNAASGGNYASKAWNEVSGVTFTNSLSDPSLGEVTYNIAANSAATASYYCGPWINFSNGGFTTNGTQYNVSYEVWCNHDMSFRSIGAEGLGAESKTIKGNQWTYVSYTSIRGSNASTAFVMYTDRTAWTVGTIFKIRKCKVEYGSKATPWIPGSSDALYNTLGLNSNIESDVSGYGNNGTRVNITEWSTNTPRYIGSTVLGNNKYIYSAYGTCNNANLFAECTVSAWIYPTSVPSGWTGGIGIDHNQSATYKKFSISNYGGYFTVHTVYNGNWNSTQYTELKLSMNTWHHIAATLSGNTVKMYLNGSLVKTFTINWGTSTNMSSNLCFCVGNDLAGSPEYFDGLQSDARLYATALSADDVKELYHTSASVDKSGNLYIGEIVESDKNIISKTNLALGRKELYSDGLSAYVQSNCQVSITSDGLYKIYRPANKNPSSDGNTMWGGLILQPFNADSNALVKGHRYILMFEVKGKSSNAVSDIRWSNSAGWQGGGLIPSPSNVVTNKSVFGANFQSDEWITFYYYWTINDDIYKVCTSSYSSFVAGNTYLSYRDFKFGFDYTDTGSMGTELYLKNFRIFDITNISDTKLIGKNSTLTCNYITEDILDKSRIYPNKEFSTNQVIEM